MTEQTVYSITLLAPLGEAFKAFEELELVMGPMLARACWSAIPKQSPRKRGPKGPHQPERDEALLKAHAKFYAGSPYLIKGAKRSVAEQLHQNYPGKYGASADAIHRKLCRLLDKQLEASIQKLIISLKSRGISFG